MSAEVATVLEERRRAKRLRDARVAINERGYCVTYRHGQVNHCPGCGRSHWWIGRSSAECGFCRTALPFASIADAMRPAFTCSATPSPGKDA